MATYQSMKIASDAKSVEEKRHQERKKALCVPSHRTENALLPTLPNPTSPGTNVPQVPPARFQITCCTAGEPSPPPLAFSQTAHMASGPT